MGRRSDHSREELEALILEEGHRHMAESGFAKFSSREVAKRIGYSVGTLYNVFGSSDRLVAAINTRTFDLCAAFLERRLAGRTRKTVVQGQSVSFRVDLGGRGLIKKNKAKTTIC